MLEQVALGGDAGERRVEHVPVLAPERVVLEEVGDALQPGALQAGRVRPAGAGQRHHRLRAGRPAEHGVLRRLVTDRLAHRARCGLHEVLLQQTHRGLQLQQVRLLLLERVVAREPLVDGGVAHGEHERGDEQRDHQLEQGEPCLARVPHWFWFGLVSCGGCVGALGCGVMFGTKGCPGAGTPGVPMPPVPGTLPGAPRGSCAPQSGW